MTSYEKSYLKWKDYQHIDSELRDELSSIEDNITEIQDRFYKNLEFGTGGMRGMIGAGSNRMNIYTVRKATQGLVNHIKAVNPDEVGVTKVVIAYDSRHKSRDFALEAALTLAQNKVKAYIFKDITPTPLLSYAVRKLKASAGIVITASHNPKEYNGYKVYGSHGGQITDSLAQAITDEIRAINDVFLIETAPEKEALDYGYLTWLEDDILEEYLLETEKLLFNKDLLRDYSQEINVVYSPLHGTGLVPIKRLFQMVGFKNLHIVSEQAEADPNFPTLVCPNPEEPEACTLALENAKKIGADLILVTDPDADRVGASIKDSDGRFIQVTGNQTGALLIDYILEMRKRNNTLPVNGAIIKTIVTSEMGAEIASKYNIKCLEVLTGFKYIGEKIAEFETSRSYEFLFGYEESYGYLIGAHARDKDAIQTCLLITEMALYHHHQGKSLARRLEELFEEMGYFLEDLINIHLAGVEGQKQIGKIMETLRREPPRIFENYDIRSFKDYLSGQSIDRKTGARSEIDLPRSNVVYYTFEDGSWCCVRPSGTEPKLKVYLGVKEKTRERAVKKLEQRKTALLAYLNTFKNGSSEH